MAVPPYNTSGFGCAGGVGLSMLAFCGARAAHAHERDAAVIQRFFVGLCLLVLGLTGATVTASAETSSEKREAASEPTEEAASEPAPSDPEDSAREEALKKWRAAKVTFLAVRSLKPHFSRILGALKRYCAWQVGAQRVEAKSKAECLEGDGTNQENEMLTCPTKRARYFDSRLSGLKKTGDALDRVLRGVTKAALRAARGQFEAVQDLVMEGKACFCPEPGEVEPGYCARPKAKARSK